MTSDQGGTCSQRRVGQRVQRTKTIATWKQTPREGQVGQRRRELLPRPSPRPARVNTPETVGVFKLFAELIASHLDTSEQLAAREAELLGERSASEVREQFIAMLGHDLRNPLASIYAGARLLPR
jgi:signal transduction histidine kinase